jgi:hypothetical protein
MFISINDSISLFVAINTIILAAGEEALVVFDGR